MKAIDEGFQDVDSSSQEEEFVIKNIDTGQSHSAHQLTLHLSELPERPRPPPELQQKELLQLITQKNHSQLEDYLTCHAPQLSSFRYLGGWTLLHFSVSNNDPVAADLLLRFGIDGNAQTQEMRRTALHEAAQGNKGDLVELLAGWGVDPNVRDAQGNTAMHFAVDFGYCDIVKSLLACSISVDLTLRNHANMTPFNTCRSPEIFELLAAYSGKIDHSKQSQVTAGSSCSSRNNYESRLIVRNSEVIPHTSRVDMVEKFLSVREQPLQRKSSFENSSVISEESYEDSLGGSHYTLDSPKRKGLKKVGSYLRSNIKSSLKIASQNVGLMRESMIKVHLEKQDQIEHYDRLRRLGRGSFAEVFLVRKKRSSLFLALKAIDKVRVAEDGLRSYVYAERKILTEIKHPFLLRAHSCLQDLSHLYILTEFCAGGDLEKVIRKKFLPERIARTYLCEAALALQEVHNHGMLYRDLKTANALLDSEGHLRLADFGLAKEGTCSNSFLGSLNYLAPEMLEKKMHGKALDWYLLGVFAYQLLHGLPPFYSEDREEGERKVLEEDVVFKEGLSEECRELLRGLLEKSEEKRIKSLEELKKARWLETVDWRGIESGEGEVLEVEVESWKGLRRKEWNEQSGEKEIRQNIQWYDNWNFPLHAQEQ